MAASLRHLLAHSNFSRPFSRYLLWKYFENKFSYAGRSLLFMIAMRRSSFHSQNPSFNVSNSLVKSRFFHVGSQAACTAQSSGHDDPEFVTEQVSLENKNIKNFGDMIKNIKQKTGVIMKAIDAEKGWKILIGGTRHEVQQAVFYLKSSVDQDLSNQRLILLQDENIDQQYSTRKEKPIWAYYRRNFKGQKPPLKTRKKCFRGKGESQIVSGNPCPICRLYLAGGYELDYKDVDLLSQFISPHTGELFEASKTGLCRHQQQNLITAIKTAKDYGLLPYTVPGPRSTTKPAQRAELPVNVRLK